MDIRGSIHGILDCCVDSALSPDGTLINRFLPALVPFGNPYKQRLNTEPITVLDPALHPGGYSVPLTLFVHRLRLHSFAWQSALLRGMSCYASQSM